MKDDDNCKINSSHDFHTSCVYHYGLIERINGLKCKIDEREKQSNLQLEALERALLLAKKELERRLESMNEFREQLRTQANTFVSRNEYSIEHKNIVNKISYIEKIQNHGQGETTWKNNLIMAGIAIAVYLLGRLMLKI